MITAKKVLFILAMCFTGISILLAQDDLNILYTLDLGLPPSGLNIDRVGSRISVIGDINGDGFDDWATRGGVEYKSGTGNHSIHIYLGGKERRISETPADIVFYPGGNIKKAGDVNGDGFDDILGDGTWLDEESGRLVIVQVLYYGGDPFDTEADIMFRKLDIHAGMANFSSDAGDVNNDGFDDILLSIPTPINGTDTAHVYLFYGAENMDNIPDVIFSSHVEFTLNGPVAFNFTGATAAGDMNNDGFDDIIINAHNSAKVYFGSANMDNQEDVVFTDFRGAGLGTGPGVGDAGDVNNDGFDDILMTANIYATKAFICYGGTVVDSIPDVVIPMWKEDSNPGFSATTIGDVNNDGFDDILLGTSTTWSIDLGQARVFYGSAEMDSIADILLDAPQPWTVFGYSVAGGGDFDGDGYPDFLVGDIGRPSTLNKHDDAGNISLFYGGETVPDSAGAVFSGIADMEGFGSSVAYAGDVNNDGYPDIIVGAVSHWEGPYHYAGRAYLYYGGDSYNSEPDLTFNTTFVYNGYHAYFGKKVGSAGDINGDGFDDIFVEEYFKVSIFLGGAPMDTIADFVLNLKVSDYSFSAVGDVNNDGFDDIVYGKQSDGTGGTAYLLLGGENLLDGYDAIIEGETSSDNLGTKTSAAGDLNGDGYADFIIAVPGDDSNGSNTGAVQVFFGKDTISSTPDLVLYGTEADPFTFDFSSNLGGGGDINNDGFDDIVISNGRFSLSSESFEGRIYIFYGGSSMDDIVDVVLTGKSEKMYLGLRTIKLFHDMNDDGYDEILTSEGNYQSGGDDREKPVIFYGGAPLDSVSDIILPYSSMGSDFGTYIDNQDNSVRLLVGDPYNRAAGPSMGRVIVYSTTVTGLIHSEQIELAPANFVLQQNYPNPFNPRTIISYQLAVHSQVELSIYNVLGQKVATLVSKQQAAGQYQVHWDASEFPSGLYFYYLNAGKHSEVRKMMMLK